MARTKTITQTIYKFSELSDQAKDKVRQFTYESLDYLSSEISASLDAFCDHFNIRYNQINYEEPYRNSYSIGFNEYAEDLEGVRLATYIYNHYLEELYKGKYYSKGKWEDGKYTYKKKYSRWLKEISCPFTGVYYDMELLQPLLEFCNKPNNKETFETLLDACIESLCTAVQNEIKYRCSDEAIIEDCEANGWEFDENGNIA